MIPDNHRCSFRTGKTWWTYSFLEERLNQISRYVTFSDSNDKTWGEEIASFLILAGSATDTFFRTMKECPYIQSESSYSTTVDLVKKRKEEGGISFWTIDDYRTAFEPIYELSENTVDVPFGLDYYGEIRPFEAFRDKRVPEWWTAYNGLKHDYYDKIPQANLSNGIHCLAGLLILNSLHKCSQEYLAIFRILKDKYSQINPPYRAGELQRSMTGYKRMSHLVDPYVKTEQFLFILRQDEKEE